MSVPVSFYASPPRSPGPYNLQDPAIRSASPSPSLSPSSPLSLTRLPPDSALAHPSLQCPPVDRSLSTQSSTTSISQTVVGKILYTTTTTVNQRIVQTMKPPRPASFSPSSFQTLVSQSDAGITTVSHSNTPISTRTLTRPPPEGSPSDAPEVVVETTTSALHGDYAIDTTIVTTTPLTSLGTFLLSAPLTRNLSRRHTISRSSAPGSDASRPSPPRRSASQARSPSCRQPSLSGPPPSRTSPVAGNSDPAAATTATATATTPAQAIAQAPQAQPAPPIQEHDPHQQVSASQPGQPARPPSQLARSRTPTPVPNKPAAQRLSRTPSRTPRTPSQARTPSKLARTPSRTSRTPSQTSRTAPRSSVHEASPQQASHVPPRARAAIERPKSSLAMVSMDRAAPSAASRARSPSVTRACGCPKHFKGPEPAPGPTTPKRHSMISTFSRDAQRNEKRLSKDFAKPFVVSAFVKPEQPGYLRPSPSSPTATHRTSRLSLVDPAEQRFRSPGYFYVEVVAETFTTAEPISPSDSAPSLTSSQIIELEEPTEPSTEPSMEPPIPELPEPDTDAESDAESDAGSDAESAVKSGAEETASPSIMPVSQDNSPSAPSALLAPADPASSTLFPRAAVDSAAALPVPPPHSPETLVKSVELDALTAASSASLLDSALPLAITVLPVSLPAAPQSSTDCAESFNSGSVSPSTAPSDNTVSRDSEYPCSLVPSQADLPLSTDSLYFAGSDVGVDVGASSNTSGADGIVRLIDLDRSADDDNGAVDHGISNRARDDDGHNDKDNDIDNNDDDVSDAETDTQTEVTVTPMSQSPSINSETLSPALETTASSQSRQLHPERHHHGLAMSANACTTSFTGDGTVRTKITRVTSPASPASPAPTSSSASTSAPSARSHPLTLRFRNASSASLSSATSSSTGSSFSKREALKNIQANVKSYFDRSVSNLKTWRPFENTGKPFKGKFNLRKSRNRWAEREADQ